MKRNYWYYVIIILIIVIFSVYFVSLYLKGRQDSKLEYSFSKTDDNSVYQDGQTWEYRVEQIEYEDTIVRVKSSLRYAYRYNPNDNWVFYDLIPFSIGFLPMEIVNDEVKVFVNLYEDRYSVSSGKIKLSDKKAEIEWMLANDKVICFKTSKPSEYGYLLIGIPFQTEYNIDAIQNIEDPDEMSRKLTECVFVKFEVSLE